MQHILYICTILASASTAKSTKAGITALQINPEFLELFSECQDISRQTIRGNEGAVDGSIQFEIEMSRPNRLVSDALNSILPFASDQVSFADALVLGGVLAVKSCLGPQINFRYGRLDATHPGPPGLLFEEDGIDSDARIEDMGMTTNDLLVLVAGGHSVATVQAEASFDATPDILDNVFVKEMLGPRSQEDLLRVRLASDLQMANSVDGKLMWGAFARKESLLQSSFAAAFEKLVNLGHANLTEL